MSNNAVLWPGRQLAAADPGCSTPIDLRATMCAVCGKPVDRCEVRNALDARAIYLRFWCHGEKAEVVIAHDTIADDAEGQLERTLAGLVVFCPET